MKSTNGRHALFAVCLVFVCQSAIAQTSRPLSLSQALGAALENQPSVRSAQIGIDLASKRLEEFRAERLPTVRITETLTRGNNPVFVFGSLLEQGQFGPQNFSLPALNNPQSITNLRTAITSSVPVFDGMKRSMRISQADIVRGQTALQKKLVEQQIRFAVVRDYFGVLVAEANKQVAAEAVRTAESDVRRARDRLEAGLGVRSDVLAAQVQLAEFTQQQIQAEGDQATAKIILNVSMGSSRQNEYELTTKLSKKSFPLPNQEELVRRAMLNRPDYEQSMSAIQLADHRVSERRSEYLPELSVFGSFGSSAKNLATGSTDYAVGAGLSFNVFEPGRAARLGQAHLERNLAETELDRVADQIVVEIARAYHDYRAAEQQLAVAEATQTQAAEALRIIQDRYEAGLTSITDVLRAETALVRAQTNVVSATHSQYVRYANVLLQAGELNDVSAFDP